MRYAVNDHLDANRARVIMSAAATAAAQNALESAKRMVFGRKLTTQQVRLVCNQEIKKRTKWVLFVACLLYTSDAADE